MRSVWITIMIFVAALFMAVYVYPAGWSNLANRVNNFVGLSDSSIRLPTFEGSDFHLGLDLVGGSHLVYEADVSDVGFQSVDDAMSGVRDVIERRVNLFGVSEPIVQREGANRLIVELAGIQDINQAIEVIGLTPFLEFKEPRTVSESEEILAAQEIGERLDEDPFFLSTALTGQYLQRAGVVFDHITGRAEVSLEFDDEGADIFADITRRNVGLPVAIYLDGQLAGAPPVVQQEILTGSAIISSPDFTIESARELANRLNAGALPVPIKLISQQTVGPFLGAESLGKSLTAGLYGFLAVAVFMILYYRLPGLIAVFALTIYVIFVLAIYKAMPVTITVAGIAGFILSLGIAVDANILIFARLREELKLGKTLKLSFIEGFRRAWYSIRDGHVTTLLGSTVLYMFTTSIIKGFALTLGIGVVLSLLTSVVITKTLLSFFLSEFFEKRRSLF